MTTALIKGGIWTQRHERKEVWEAKECKYPEKRKEVILGMLPEMMKQQRWP